MGKDTEESASNSAANSAEWSIEETEELASEGEAETAGGTEEVEMTPMPTAEAPEGSGADTVPGDASSGGGATSYVTTVEADAAGVGEIYGAEKRGGDGQQENLARESSGVRKVDGDPGPPEWRETPRGGRQGVGGGVELPRKIDTPGVE